MSLSQPSQVSATTGSDHQAPVASAAACATRQAMTASRTTPTLWVLVIITGPSRKPDSSTQVVPVISPLPFCEYQPANEKRCMEASPRGSTAVTPVRTGPLPTVSLPLPEIRVVWPTSTPSMSVIAFSGPGAPSKGTPRSRARARPLGGFVRGSAAVARGARSASARRAIILGGRRYLRLTCRERLDNCCEWAQRSPGSGDAPDGIETPLHVAMSLPFRPLSSPERGTQRSAAAIRGAGAGGGGSVTGLRRVRRHALQQAR